MSHGAGPRAGKLDFSKQSPVGVPSVHPFMVRALINTATIDASSL
jgi:hypothetical protein